MIDSKRFFSKAFLFLVLACCMTGCGQNNKKETAIGSESAADAQVDFAALKEENPNIFAWLYIPDTGINCPILQDTQSDDFYDTHNAFGEKDSHGAAYIELANVNNMCDFNTVIHGNAPKKPNARNASSYPFADLSLFDDPAFFDEHEHIYVYLDGNRLTYEVFAAFERENTSLIREYDFTDTTGCLIFLDDLYSKRDLRMHLREGWNFITPYHFLVTLTAHKKDDPDRQFVVMAVLIQDEAGTINRIMEEY